MFTKLNKGILAPHLKTDIMVSLNELNVLNL